MRPSLWTEQQAYEHLLETFNINCRMFPDIMDRYVAQLEADDRKTNIEVMRRALRETLKARWPS
jgi:hypothetical protein